MHFQEDLMKVDERKPRPYVVCQLLLKLESHLPESYDELNRALRQPEFRLSTVADQIFDGG